MKTTITLALLGAAALLSAENSLGQDSMSHQTLFPSGISIEYGLGRYSVRDEYISKERYSGTLPDFRANWSRFHSKYGYNVVFEQLIPALRYGVMSERNLCMPVAFRMLSILALEQLRPVLPWCLGTRF